MANNSGNGNKLNRTVLYVIGGVVIAYVIMGAVIAVYSPTTAPIVIPIMLATLPMVIASLIGLIKTAVVEEKIDKVAFNVDGVMHELQDAKVGEATAKATLAEKVVQEEKTAAIARATDTTVTTTTTSTLESPALLPDVAIESDGGAASGTLVTALGDSGDVALSGELTVEAADTAKVKLGKGKE